MRMTGLEPIYNVILVRYRYCHNVNSSISTAFLQYLLLFKYEQ